MKIDNRKVLAGVAGAAAVATAHGGFQAARSGGAPWAVAVLYPVMSDLLAVGAWRETQRPGASRIRKVVAWLVVIGAAGASGAAQAYVLAHDQVGGAAQLAAGVGAFPALAVLVATIFTTNASEEPVEPLADVAEALRSEIHSATTWALETADAHRQEADRTLREDVLAALPVPAPAGLTAADLDAALRDFRAQLPVPAPVDPTAIERSVWARVERQLADFRPAPSTGAATGKSHPRPTGSTAPRPAGPMTGSKRARGEAAYRTLVAQGTDPASITAPMLARAAEGPDATDDTGRYRQILRDIRAAEADDRPDAEVLPLDRDRDRASGRA